MQCPDNLEIKRKCKNTTNVCSSCSNNRQVFAFVMWRKDSHPKATEAETE